MMLRVCFKKLTNEPSKLVNEIYRFMGIKIGAEYKNKLEIEAQKAKSYKSEHKYSSIALDVERILEK